MKKSFTTGLIILLPLALTIWVVWYLFDLFTAPLNKLIEHIIILYDEQHGLGPLHRDTTVIILGRIAALFLTFFFIVLLGFLGRRFFFNAFMKTFNRLIVRIPIVGTIYRLTKDITKAMFSSDQKAFKEAIIVPFPSPDSYTFGFVTGEVPPNLQKVIPDIDVSVFIPTAPHPISGYVLFCKRKLLHSPGISVEDTFKFLLSCGVIQPPASP
jgi:uncharacterized membrane protein